MNLHWIRTSIVASILLMLTLPSWGADTEIISFNISNYQVIGNTLLRSQDVEKLLENFVGEGKTFATVQSALETLQKEYHDRGYKAVAVLLPEQTLESGIVRLQVVEQTISAIEVSGQKYFNRQNILNSLPGLTPGSVPNLDHISASLRVANENPAKTAKLSLQNAATQGELIAQVNVKDQRPWSVNFSVDDTGNDSTGMQRAGILFSHANLFDRDQLLTLQYKTSIEQPDDVRIFGLGYRLPLYRFGDSVDIYAAYTDVDSGSVNTGIVDLNVAGEGTIFGLRYNQNLVRCGNFQHRLSYGFDYRIYKNNVELSGTDIGNEITVHPLQLTYSGDWKATRFASAFYVTAVKNFPAWENGQNADFAEVRQNTDGSYHLFRLGFDAALLLPQKWQGHIRGNGQWTDEPLVPGEYFGLGGASSVRGFGEREVADDRGYGINVELHTPDLASAIHLKNGHFKAFVFYDAGYLERVDPLPGEQTELGIASTGIGLQFSLGRHLSAETIIGYVLDGGGERKPGDTRGHFNINYVF